jgi:capsular exopolysaccharide synthesis family protein
VESSKHIKPNITPPEGLDLTKLRMILRNNWYWLLLIFVVINATAYLAVRYSKSIYSSESVLKLDVKETASEFGITTTVEDKNINLMASEIDIIRSELFLSQVLDSLNIDMSFYSVGRFLNDELFGVAPFSIEYTIKNPYAYNVPIYIDEDGANGFKLRVGEHGKELEGRYGERVLLDALDITVRKNVNFQKGDELGYYFIINSRGVLLSYLLGNLQAEPLNYRSNTILVSFKDHNAFKAHAVVSKIDTLYLRYSNEQNNLANSQKIEWLTNELYLIEKKMEDYENYFESFTLQNKTNNLDDDLRKTITAINRIDSQRYDVSRKLTETNRLLDDIHTHSGDFFISLLQRRVLPEGLQKNLEDLQQRTIETEKLRMSYNETTLAFREKQKDIEVLQTKAVNQLAELKADLMQRAVDLSKRKAQLESEFANMPDKSTQFNKNQRFYKLYEEFYLSLMQSKSGFEIAQAGSTPDFKILSPATLSTIPIAPKKTMIFGVGMITSLIAVLLLIGVLYIVNNKVTNAGELERNNNTPLLGVVPASSYTTTAGLHVVEHPRSMVSEAIRTLRTNLDFFTVDAEKKVIAISSTISGEGKSFIAMNLGGVIALSKKKVVLLDLDMRKAKNDLTQPEDNTKGMSTILIRKNTWQECIIKTQLESFDFIPSGPHPPNPSELLLTGEFAAMLEELKEHYDFVILDTPPVGLVTDGVMAMRKADISVYVFRANYSKKEFLNNFRRLVSMNKFSNITMLLNALPAQPGNSRGYYGYYEEPSRSSRLTSLFKK